MDELGILRHWRYKLLEYTSVNPSQAYSDGNLKNGLLGAFLIGYVSTVLPHVWPICEFTVF